MSDYMNLKTDYGAVGDGTTDDSSAINTALSACATSGKRLYIPQSNYYCASAVTSPGGFEVNADYGAQFIFTSSLTTTAFTVSGPDQRMEGLGILIPNRNTKPTSGIIGLDVQHHGSKMWDVRVIGYGAGTYQGFYTGAKFSPETSSPSWDHDLYSCNFNGNVYGAYCDTNALNFHGGVCSAAEHDDISGIGLYIHSGTGITLNGVDVEGSSAYNIFIGNPSNGSGYSGGVVINGGYTEGAVQANIGIYGYSSSVPNRGVQIHGLEVNGEGISLYGLWAMNTNGVNVTANSFEGSTTNSIYMPIASNPNSVVTPNYTSNAVVH